MEDEEEEVEAVDDDDLDVRFAGVLVELLCCCWFLRSV